MELALRCLVTTWKVQRRPQTAGRISPSSKYDRRFRPRGIGKILTRRPGSGIAKDPEALRTQLRQRLGGSVTLVAELLLEPLNVRLDKGFASKNHSVSKILDPTEETLGQTKFSVLFLNDMLRSSQINGRRFVCAAGTPCHKQVFAVLAAKIRPGDSLRLAQNGSNPLPGKRTTYAKGLPDST